MKRVRIMVQSPVLHYDISAHMTLSRCLLAPAMIVVTLTAGLAHAQDTTGARRSALAGVVRDTLGHPVAGATVSVEGTAMSTATDDSGRFHLPAPTGKNDFAITKIGYKPLAFTTTLPADSTVMIEVRMRRVQTLAAVTATARSERLARQGFYERQKLGFGRFLTPERIDSLYHVSTPSQLLRDVPGVVVRCRSAGRCMVMSTQSSCLNLFINGAFTRGQIDDVLPTGEVYAIEVYHKPIEVPLEFRWHNYCGAIVVWTRTFSK